MDSEEYSFMCESVRSMLELSNSTLGRIKFRALGLKLWVLIGAWCYTRYQPHSIASLFLFAMQEHAF